MTLIEDAKRLADWKDSPYHANEWGMTWCGHCNGSMDTVIDHTPTCPWVTVWPRILAALEQLKVAMDALEHISGDGARGPALFPRTVADDALTQISVGLIAATQSRLAARQAERGE